jgi:hypothetical protein
MAVSRRLVAVFAADVEGYILKALEEFKLTTQMIRLAGGNVCHVCP